jgi:hypothetical protein
LVLLGAIAALAILGSLLPTQDGEKNPQSAASQAASLPPAIAPTPAGLQPGTADAQYCGAIHEEASEVNKSVLTFGRLLSNPQPTDDNWRTQVVMQLALWKVVYSQAQHLAPPPRFHPVQSCWLDALSRLSDAADGYARAIDDVSADEIRNATERLDGADARAEECTRLIEQAQAQ